MGTIFQLLVLLLLVSFAYSSLIINELNTDCAPDDGSCKFIELAEMSCDTFQVWQRTSSLYLVILETGPEPNTRLLANLTFLTVQPGGQLLTLCDELLVGCNYTFNQLHEQQNPVHPTRHGRKSPTMLIEGNKYPVVAILMETSDHNTVANLFMPVVTVVEGKAFTDDALTFTKLHMTDAVVYGSRTPYHGCDLIEDLIPELTNRNLAGPLVSQRIQLKTYVNRELDVYGMRDMSLSRCAAANDMILAYPSRGVSNNCDWYFHLLFQPNDESFSWIEKEWTKYNDKRSYYQNRGGCYTTWVSQMFKTFHHEMTQKRAELWSTAPPLITDSRKRTKRSDDDSPVCSPEKKKPMFTCSQTPAIIDQVAEECIVRVMKRKGVASFPGLTDCGLDGPDAELLPLIGFEGQPEAPEDEDDFAPGTMNDADAIMSRAGFYNYDVHNLRETKVCRKHSLQLGKNGFKEYLLDKVHGKLRSMKRGKHIVKCVFPHTPLADAHGEVSSAKNSLHISKGQSEAIYRYTGLLVPVGLPVCHKHMEVANRYQAMYSLYNNPLPESTGGGHYATRHHSPVCYAESDSASQPLFCSITGDHSCPASQDNPACPLPETNLERIRRLMLTFRKEQLIDKWHYTDQYNELSQRSKVNYCRSSQAAWKLINFALTGDDQKQFERDMENAKDKQWNKGRSGLSSLQTLSRIYHSLQSTVERQLVLGVHALSLPYRLVSTEVSGVTRYQYTKARALARQYAVGEPTLPPVPGGQMRLDSAKVDIFIEYIIDNMTPMPWGVKSKKLSCGTKINIPQYISQIRKKKQIKEFLSYLDQIGREDLKMSRATYYRILKVLSSGIQYRKSTTGLDYKTNAGLEAFERLVVILCRAHELKMMNDETFSNLKSAVEEGKNYLRGDYKYHISQSSPVADHCSLYALSDPTDERYQRKCDHEHNQVCQRCQKLKATLDEIQMLVAEAEYPDDREKAIAIQDVDTSVNDIEEMKKHRLRTNHQSLAKTDLLKTMSNSQALIIADFAMKILPSAGREDQTSFFGKRGMNWHISYVIRKLNGLLHYRIIQHVYSKTVPQDSATVSAILNDTLIRLHEDAPELTEVYLRTDNAGNYHSATMLAAVTQLNQELPIRVVRWDFSEAQSGKDACDQTASVVKRRIREYVDENHKARTAQEVAVAAHSDGGITGVTTVVVHDTISTEPNDYRSPKVQGIQSLSNFAFINDGERTIKAWRSYTIGTGMDIRFAEQNIDSNWIDRGTAELFNSDRDGFIEMGKQPESCLLVLPQDDTDISHDGAAPRADTQLVDGLQNELDGSDDPHCLRLFQCPIENCIKSYNKYANLQRHIALGNHQFYKESETLSDYALKRFSDFTMEEEIRTALNTIPEEFADYEKEHREGNIASMNWASRKPPQRTRFTQDQKAYMIELFVRGVAEKSKFEPRTIADQMVTAKKLGSNEYRFKPNELLRWQQIASFWSAYAKKKRSEPVENVEIVDDKIVEVPSELYVEDENLPSDDTLIDQAKEYVMKNIAA